MRRLHIVGLLTLGLLSAATQACLANADFNHGSQGWNVPGTLPHFGWGSENRGGPFEWSPGWNHRGNNQGPSNPWRPETPPPGPSGPSYNWPDGGGHDIHFDGPRDDHKGGWGDHKSCVVRPVPDTASTASLLGVVLGGLVWVRKSYRKA